MLLFKSLSVPVPAKLATPKRLIQPRCDVTGRSTSQQSWMAWSSPIEVRVALLVALTSQASSLYQRSLIDAAKTTAKLVLPPDARNLEEALMSVPDLESVDYTVIGRTDEYEIRQVSSYFVAETTMPGSTGFDFVGASRSFNVLAAYLFGKNERNDAMELTSPVYIRRGESSGEKMKMTTPVITKKENDETWRMSFIIPAKYGANPPLPKDSSVRITQVPPKILAVSAFSGFVTDDEMKQRESKLRMALKDDDSFKVKEGALVEVAQYNPPYTLPFRRRNEVALEIERKD